MSLGWSAIILYPIAVYLLSWHIPMWAMAMRVSPMIKLISNILFSCSIFFVRGSIATWIAFSVTYVVVVCISWPFFRPYVRMACGNET
jgi:energy-coupling factor transporter transmembrane protein EcfT